MNNMMETNINLMFDNQQEEEQWREKNFESISIDKSVSTDNHQSSSIFVVLIIIAIIQSKFIQI
jgi:hypothetical protein